MLGKSEHSEFTQKQIFLSEKRNWRKQELAEGLSAENTNAQS